MDESNKEYQASLKSLETENKVDRIFYRPIGFRLAKLLRGTGITPNMVTILSIFVGVGAGVFFYPQNIVYNCIGILCLVAANILDCVDGQLARLTGIKSEIGRILDGLAGDIWFLCIYISFSLRLADVYGTYWFFAIALLSALSHLLQANITDYYKTLHLYFISKEKGKEFQTADEIEAIYRTMKPGISKVFYYFYRLYTLLQMKATPSLQAMLKSLHARYGDDIPEELRVAFRKESKTIMKRYVDLLTFNGRTIVMFVVVLSGQVWLYFLYEIIILNIILAIAMYKHEKVCAEFLR